MHARQILSSMYAMSSCHRLLNISVLTVRQSGNDADEERDDNFKISPAKPKHPTKRAHICVDSKENASGPAKRQRQELSANLGRTSIVVRQSHHPSHPRTAKTGNIVERIRAQHQRAQRTLIEHCAVDRTLEQGVANSLRDTVKAMREMNRRCVERTGTWRTL